MRDRGGGRGRGKRVACGQGPSEKRNALQKRPRRFKGVLLLHVVRWTYSAAFLSGAAKAAGSVPQAERQSVVSLPSLPPA